MYAVKLRKGISSRCHTAEATSLMGPNLDEIPEDVLYSLNLENIFQKVSLKEVTSVVIYAVLSHVA